MQTSPYCSPCTGWSPCLASGCDNKCMATALAIYKRIFPMNIIIVFDVAIKIRKLWPPAYHDLSWSEGAKNRTTGNNRTEGCPLLITIKIIGVVEIIAKFTPSLSVMGIGGLYCKVLPFSYFAKLICCFCPLSTWHCCDNDNSDVSSVGRTVQA